MDVPVWGTAGGSSSIVQGIEFDAVNDNLTETLEKYGTDSRKITADYYIDDKMHGIIPFILSAII